MTLVTQAYLQVQKVTKRARVLLAFSIFILLISPFTGSYTSKIMGLGLFLTSLLIGLIFYASVKEGALHSLQAKRIIPKPIIEQKPTRIKIVFSNPTRMALELLEVSEKIPPTWKSKGETSIITVPPGGSVVWEYEVVATPGSYSIGPLVAIYRDPLGLTEMNRVVLAKQSITVHPRPLDIPRKPVSFYTYSPAGIIRSKRRGQGLLFLEIREYHPDDDFRYIDWKSTARMGQPMVKEFEQESVANIIIVLDLTRTMFSGMVGRTKFEYSLRITASLIEYLSRLGYTYKLMIVNHKGKVLTSPWYRGRASAGLAREFLALHSEWPSYRFLKSISSTTLRSEVIYNQLIKTLSRSKTFIIIISDLMESDGYASDYGKSLAKVKILGHDIIIITPLTVAFEARELGASAELYRVLAYEKIKIYKNINKMLAKSGIRMVATGPRDLLSYIIARLEVASA